MSNFKQPPYRNHKILDFARGQDCQHCGKNDGTTVAAHEGGLESGKGMGIKAPDNRTAYLCEKCHNVYDQHLGMFSSDTDRMFFFHRAIFRTQYLWLKRFLPSK